MSYYRTCPHCGDNLDPGEKCRCREEKGTQEQGKTIPVAVASRKTDSVLLEAVT